MYTFQVDTTGGDIHFTSVDSGSGYPQTRLSGSLTFTVRIVRPDQTSVAGAGTITQPDSTNAPGVRAYRYDTNDFPEVGSYTIRISATGMETREIPVQIVAYNPHDGVRLGLTALPNAAANTAGGLPVLFAGSGTSGILVNGSGWVHSNIHGVRDTAIPIPNVAGVLRVDLTHVEGADGAVAAIQSGLATSANQSTIINATDTLEAELASAHSKLDAIDNYIDTEVAAIVSATDTLEAGQATIIGHVDTLEAAVAAVQADTDNIQTRLPAALVNGRMDSYVGELANDVITAAKVAADVGTEIATAVWDFAVEGVFTAKQLMRGYASALFGKSTGQNTTTRRYRDLADTKDRIVATTDATGRTAITPNLD